MRISNALAVCLSACTFSSSLNGKKFGGGGGGPTASSSSSPPSSSASGSSGSSGSSDAPASAAEQQRLAAVTTTGPCDASHDHCLEAENWFALSFYEDQKPEDKISAYPGLWVEKSTAGAPWIWGYRCDCQVGGYGVRTVLATRDNIAVERRVVVYFDVDDKAPQLPSNEGHARKDNWRAGVITSVDAAAGTFRMTSHTGPVKFAFARVVVAHRESVPERPQKFPLPFKDPAP